MINNSNDVAEILCKNGFAVIPIHSVNEHGKCGCGKSDCNSPGKHPTTINGVKGFTHDLNQISQWLNEGKNIACATGEPSAVWVLDVDQSAALERLNEFGQMPQTWTARTGRGTHYFFKLNDQTKNLKNSTKLFGGIDVRATGGYVILPPSKHHTGNTYSWVVSPDSMPVATAPDWLVSLLPKHGDELKQKPVAKSQKIGRASTTEERCKKYLESVPPAISGESGHNHTFSTACRIVELFGNELDDSELLDCLSDWNDRCEPPWTESQIEKKIRDARKQTGIESADDCIDSGSDSVADDSVASGDDSGSESEIDYPTLHDDAYCGVIGELVKAVEPETEADGTGVLLSLLTAFGNSIGRGPHVSISADSHGCNLFTCIVGDSASGKGQAWNIAKMIVQKVDRDWNNSNCSYGLSSGEGLVERVADPNDEDVFKIPTVRKLLCVETEFAKPISAMRREGNTLSPLLRSAWDCAPLEVMTRGKSKLRAANAFISILAHITPHEMKKLFDGSVETSNGFANRFLWCLVKSTKSLPHGGNLSVVDKFIPRLREAIEKAKSIGKIGESVEYRTHWESVYDSLKESKGGTFGAATERARPQVLRLALLFALLDGSPTRELKHLKAALAVWHYCEESARLLFSSDEQLSNCNKSEKKIVQMIKAKPGVMRSELKRGISHRVSTTDFTAMIDRLLSSGKIVIVPVMEKRSADTFYPGVRTSRTVVVPDSVLAAKAVAMEEQKSVPELPALMPAPSSVKAATLSELLDWKNQNGIQFTYSTEKSIYWVTQQGTGKVTAEIEAAIRQNQDTVKVFSISTPTATIEPAAKIETLSVRDFLRMPAPAATSTEAIEDGWSEDMTEESFLQLLRNCTSNN